MGEGSYEWTKPILGDERFKIILETRRKIEKILENNILKHYTKHDIEHSDRIIQCLAKLLEIDSNNPGSITPDELFILLLTALYHDIGMQIPDAHHITKNINELTLDDLEEIRKNHGKVSALIIRSSLAARVDKYNLGILEPSLDPYLSYVAEICEKHQSCNSYEPSAVEILGSDCRDQKLRQGILICLIRLADTLDCDHRRIDIDLLQEFNIPVESKVHWFACHYIDAVEIENGIIRVYSSFPENLSSSVINYFGTMIINNIESELDGCGEELWSNGIKLKLDKRVIKKKSEYAVGKRNVPSELIDFVRSQLTDEGETKVVVQKRALEDTSKIDWMSYWGMIGNPFSDYPLDYGSTNLVMTQQLQRITAEVHSYLKGQKGELRLLVAERGQGKTTLFQVISGEFKDTLSVFLIDVGDRVANIRNVGDLTNFVFSAIYNEIANGDGHYSPENLLSKSKMMKKSIILLDSLDRLTESQDEIVRQFFTSAQHILTTLKHNTILILSCSKRWNKIVESDELSYLGPSNQWVLEPFSTADAQLLLTRRLKTAGIGYDEVFDHGCIGALQTMSEGNPRRLLNLSEAICRYGALEEIEQISVDFIRKRFKSEFEKDFLILIEQLNSKSTENKDALIHIYTFLLEMDKRNLDTRLGCEYLIQSLNGKVPQENVIPGYYVPIKFVCDILYNDESKNLSYSPRKHVREFFKQLKVLGYEPGDFISFYLNAPFLPEEEKEDVIRTIRSGLLDGEDVNYFEQSRMLYDEVISATSKTSASIVSKSWDAIENMIVAIMIKRGLLKAAAYETVKEEAFLEDRYKIKRYRPGAGKILAKQGEMITHEFYEEVVKDNNWMNSWTSLIWILKTRNNIVRGRSEFAAQFGQKEMDISKNHLRLVFKELVSLYK